MSLLEARGIHFGYGSRPVLQGISLALAAGESLALLGANGSGKSTLLKLLLGLHRPRSGAVFLEGRPIAGLSAKAVAQRIAYVPQDHGAVFPYTALDVVLMGRLPHQPLLAYPSRADREVAEAALERLGISALGERAYTELSGGERQLVLIARALAQEAPILIMDEPVTGLDYGNQIRLLARIRDLAESGYAIVQTTHYPDHALAAASRVLLLKDGRLLAQGRPEETVTPENLHALYGVQAELRTLEDGRRMILPELPKGGGEVLPFPTSSERTITRRKP